jgi:ATP-dependent DNA helicase DinG
MPTELSSRVAAFFARDGYLSRWHPSFEYRADQLRMARAVEAAIQNRKHLVVEAGTGTGKTLAYLVPALLSGKRVVISTGTKNLQEQLFFKDLPLLQQHWGRPLRVSIMKGRGNYLCKSKFHDAQKAAILDGLHEVHEFEQIQRWEPITISGDRAELATIAEDSRLWPKLDARSDRCSGQRCVHFEDCFVTHMHRVAHESDVIIVNHHLLFADLAVKDTEYGAVIPEYAVLILDEAHEIEDVAGQYFGMSVTNLQVQELTRDLRLMLRAAKRLDERLEEVADWVDEAAHVFFAQFEGPEGRIAAAVPRQVALRNETHYRQLLTALSLFGNTLKLHAEAVADFGPLFRRAGSISSDLQTWMEDPADSSVHWLERRSRMIALQSCPIDVSSILQEKLFDTIDTVVLTSATLAVGDSFEFVQQRLGIQGAETLRVEGHFDYPTQALLFTPTSLPDPRSPDYAEHAMALLEHILHTTEGRAFVLFTSHQQMRFFHQKLRDRLPFPLLLQGTAPKHHLLEEFQQTPNPVLFATSSFWQGVDVPGEQLSCVVIDKLPFAVPSDPVVSARVQQIRESGRDAFRDYQIPQVAIALKQGFGRLIRSGTDRGLLAILDRRIQTMPYGRTFLESLPPYRRTTRFEDVNKFFANGNGQ